ncbi:MAG: GNAT family N-acetyltransferase [Saprospiraceae bacterium]
MIRPYTEEDKQRLIEILRTNIPQYFAPSEEQDFIEYLDKHRDLYFVLELKGRVFGAGGINRFPDTGIARISWDMIHSDMQYKGLGSQLVRYRIDEIKKDPSIHKIVVRTSQHVYSFYENLGFDLLHTEPDFWAPGFDLYQMEMIIN